MTYLKDRILDAITDSKARDINDYEKIELLLEAIALGLYCIEKDLRESR